jgi:protein-export membrane protein SecD
MFALLLVNFFLLSMSRSSSSSWPMIVSAIILFASIVAVPSQYKSSFLGFNPDFHLGLDLAGGTQLDFRISEDEINTRIADLEQSIDAAGTDGSVQDLDRKRLELRTLKEQKDNLVEAVRTVLERRINSLGVSEAVITPSYFGNEKHLLVECPGVIDAQRCIATVGKTIRLEFKEEFDGDPSEYINGMRKKADATFKTITSGADFQVVGQDLSNDLGVNYIDSRPLFLSSLPKGLEALKTRTVSDPVLRSEASISTTVQGADGTPQLKTISGIYLTKILQAAQSTPRPLTNPAEAYDQLAKTLPEATSEHKDRVSITTLPAALLKTAETMEIGSDQAVALDAGKVAVLSLLGRIEGDEQMDASHILFQYKGAQRADASVVRSKAEAKALAEKALARVKAGESLDTIAKNESDGPSRGKSGSLGTIRRRDMAEPFALAAFALKKGELSAVTETEFGFHVIRADSDVALSPAMVTYDLLTYKGTLEDARALPEKIAKGEITAPDQQIVIRSLFFSLEPTGWKDTALNGQRFRSASVTTDQFGTPVTQILFDEEGGRMFQALTKKNIGKRIAIFVGGELVSAPTVNGEISGGSAIITGSRNFEEAQKLAQDLNTGAIPAPIYLAGQSTIEATLGTSALHQSVFAAGVGFILLCLFLIVIYRSLGVIASIALLVYTILMIAMMKLPLLLITNSYVVLTLAGIAGIILSMGMAVDANVLVFERIYEELHKGKPFKIAVETGFKRAWPSVRDGNTSTLITCGILFIIGTSIIRGFSIALSLGILTSLFTGMVVSHYLCRKLAHSPLAEKLFPSR